jgi:hypothetical protein
MAVSVSTTVLLSSALVERLHSAGVDRHTRGMEDAGDHAPVWVKLRHGPAGFGKARRQTIAATTMPPPKTERSTNRTGAALGKQH